MQKELVMLESSKLKIYVIFLSIFTLISVLITYNLIKNTLDKRYEKRALELIKTSEKIVDKDNVLGLQLTDEFKENDLFIAEKTHLKNSHSNVTYIIINGLKNKKIQNQINDEIKRETINLYNKYYEKKEYKNYRATAGLTGNGNYNNLLSVYVEISCTKGDEYHNEYIYLNYRLDTGEHLNFTDFFSSTANIKQIISTSSYGALARNYLKKEKNFNDIDYSKIEYDQYKLLQTYQQHGIDSFRFSDYFLEVEINKQKIYIYFADYPGSIVLSRFITEKSLYEKEKADAYYFSAFGNRAYTKKSNISIFNKLEDNLFIDYSMFIVYENNKNYKEELVLIDKYIENLRNTAKANPDRGYYLLIDANSIGDSGTQVWNESTLYETTRKYFDKNTINDIRNKYRARITRETEIFSKNKYKITKLDNEKIGFKNTERYIGR